MLSPTYRRLIPNTPGAPTRARRYVREVLADLSDDVLDPTEVMVSELATNCVRHAGAGFVVTVERTADEIRVDIADRGPGVVELRDPHASEPSGRGLRIVDRLADHWGVRELDREGKGVWFTLSVTGGDRGLGR